jgi:hypothetical protein
MASLVERGKIRARLAGSYSLEAIGSSICLEEECAQIHLSYIKPASA